MRTRLIERINKFIDTHQKKPAEIKSDPEIELKLNKPSKCEEAIAEAYNALKICDQALKELNEILTPLEERLKNKPKPSEELGWYY